MYLRPLWEKESRTVYGESGLFQGEKPVRLLFKAEKILQVANPTLNVVYEENVHFRHTPGSDLIYPVKGSGICGIGEGDIFPDPAKAILFPSPRANAIGGNPDGRLLLFDNRSFFAGCQIVIDYRAVEGTEFPEMPPVYGSLPKFKEGLRQGRTLAMTLIGDSISEGFNSTEFVKAPPYAPPYLNILAQKLKKKFNTHICALNSAVAGTGSRHAWAIDSRWLTPPCDLLLIAFGMNELETVSPEDYRDEVKKIMEAKRAVHPDTEFILITSMTRHPTWLGESVAASKLFADKLKELAGPGCAVADLHALWTKVLERKDFYDITGNGVNHPNDYGHRLYTAVLENIFA